jgi:hypothetical protein
VIDPRVLYVDLLTAASSEFRMMGIARWAEHHGPREDLVPLLADTAPVVHVHGGRRMISEVRAAALVTLQDRYRLVKDAWDLGPVTVRKAMPVEEAVRRAGESLTALPVERREAVLDAVDLTLARVVQPLEKDREACRAYVVLQELGEVDYLVQSVNAVSLLTPLQEEIHASQMKSPRPTPHVRFDGDHGPVGYLYRDRHWVLDFDESPLGRDIRDLVRLWMGVERGGVPRVLFDADGRPLTDEDGRAFRLDGVVPDDTDTPLDYLRSVAAFVGRHHRCQVIP